ncbi:MAG: potassium channel family protein [Gammaproteobacteria bacterium]
MPAYLTERDNFLYLTVALTLLLFGTALVGQFSSVLGHTLLQATIVMALLISVWGARANRVWYRTWLGFQVALALLTLAGQFLQLKGLDVLHLLVMLAFFSLSTWRAIRQVLFTGQIDTNKILGAICIYLLLGLAWSILYLLLLEITPDALKGLPPAHWYANFDTLVYFSFVTLTTLGFGDITPVTPIARFLVYMEAIAGQFYLAILVASLVGIHVSDYMSRHHKELYDSSKREP